MTPGQARELAAVLSKAAEVLEQGAFPDQRNPLHPESKST